MPNLQQYLFVGCNFIGHAAIKTFLTTMTQLEKLYQSIQHLKELGVKLPDDLIDQTNRVEEEIIKKDVIPALADTISPVIKQIQREIILVVEYVPDEPVSVRWTRKRSMTIPLELDFANDNKKKAFSERETVTISPHSKSSKTTLSIKFPDGKIISHRFAYHTLVDTIKVVGHEKVKKLNIICCGVPLVSETKDDFYTQHELTKGVYIMTHSSTRTKKDQLDEISKKLGLGLKTEIV
jgi:hypothetical protein